MLLLGSLFVLNNGVESWTLLALHQKHMNGFEMWCWRRIEKISWIGHVTNEVLLTAKEQREYST
jgi:hypothetical protein